MLTSEPKPKASLEEGAIPTGALGLVPSLVVPMQLCDELMLGNKEPFGPTPSVPGNHDLTSESSPLSVGKLGSWQEYLQKLKTKARILVEGLQELEISASPLFCQTNLVTVVGDDDTYDSDFLNVRAPSLHLPSDLSTYFQVIQEELFDHVVRAALHARTLLQDALKTLRDSIRLVSALIVTLLASVFSTHIFCSVLWEKRRWFLLHGARPPKSIQAVWACLPEAYSRSPLA